MWKNAPWVQVLPPSDAAGDDTDDHSQTTPAAGETAYARRARHERRREACDDQSQRQGRRAEDDDDDDDAKLKEERDAEEEEGQHHHHLTREEVERYSRHLILEEVGVAGQLRLKRASVLCVGAGGLGSPALLYLAAAGVGRLAVVDDDVVEVSNLQRQIAHDVELVGAAKTTSAANAVRRINPGVRFEGITKRLESLEDATHLFSSYDVIVDGSDNFATKYLVDDACVEAGKPNVYAAILRFEGHVSVFNHPPGKGATYRDYLPDAPPPGAVPSCAEGGVLGVLCGVLGAIQATEVVKLVLQRPVADTLANRLLCYDALKMTFRELPLCKLRAEPTTTTTTTAVSTLTATTTTRSEEGRDARQPQRQILPPTEEDDGETTTAAPASTSAAYETIAPAEAAARLADGWAPFVLDVRLPQEAQIAALPFADALVPHRRVADVATDIPTDRDVLVHCKSGFRSNLACQTLAKLGHTRLFNLEGGILAWADQVDPRLPKY